MILSPEGHDEQRKIDNDGVANFKNERVLQPESDTL